MLELWTSTSIKLRLGGKMLGDIKAPERITLVFRFRIFLIPRNIKFKYGSMPDARAPIRPHTETSDCLIHQPA